MYHVVICIKEYHAPFDNASSIIYRKEEVYQAENLGEEFRVWRNPGSFLRFSPHRFNQYFRIFC